MILEAYQQYAIKHDYTYIDPEDGTEIPMIRLNRAKFFKYHFSYIRGLQDFVVTGVKHNDNGSADFESIFLRNIADEKNGDKVRSILQGSLGLSPKETSDILRIVTWAEMTGMRVAASSFLKLYNKGNYPTKDSDIEAFEKHKEFVQKHTYFGMLLKPIYDVIYTYQHANEIQEARSKKEMEAILAQVDAELSAQA